jgi:phosphatidylserine/phosphatidylglycerophosphate/cardiolipin synthase-like enzyme
MSRRPSQLPATRVITSVVDRRDTILDVIRHAEREVCVSLFRCNDAETFEELGRAVKRGVAVNALITSRAKGGQNKLKKLWHALHDTGATISAYADAVVKYHAKYLVADDGPAVVGSCNFTRKCFERTCDALVVTYDGGVVWGLRELMAADRDGRRAPDTITERLVIGPERARRQLTAIVEQARSSIRVIDAKLSDPDLVTLLNAKRAEGLTVEVFGSKHVGGLISHGKIVLVDDRLALVGSLALAAISLDFRREVAIVVDEPDAVAEVRGLFRSIDAAPSIDAEGLAL